MESREWANYRSGLFDCLTERRPTVQGLRFECVAASRTKDLFRFQQFNSKLIELIKVDKPFMESTRDAFWLTQYLAPMWSLTDAFSTGPLLRVEFDDNSGRNRDRFICRFVSDHAPSVLIYSALSMHLLDLNTYLEEISSLFEISD